MRHIGNSHKLSRSLLGQTESYTFNERKKKIFVYWQEWKFEVTAHYLYKSKNNGVYKINRLTPEIENCKQFPAKYVTVNFLKLS